MAAPSLAWTVGALAYVVAAIGLVFASGAATTDAEEEDQTALAAAYLEQAERWVNLGEPGPKEVRSFFAQLEDVQLHVEGRHQEGHLELWLAQPDKFRQAWRRNRNATEVTTKILNGDHLWLLRPGAQARRVSGTRDGAAAVEQMRADRDRLADAARFFSLAGLRGPGVRLTYLGEETGGRGDFAGRWLMIRRQSQGERDIVLYLAYETDADGTRRATYPGVVKTAADAAADAPERYFVFSRWTRGARAQRPTKIQAFRVRGGDEPLARELLAYPRSFEINAPLDDAHFRPPSPRESTPR